MQPDDEICHCYHVTLRKLVNFARRERPSHPAGMTECLGAGTGCGWCVPFLTAIAASPDDLEGLSLPESAADYAAARASYRESRSERRGFSDDE